MDDDQARVEAIRAELPATQQQVYLNAGTNGPLPRRVHDALAAWSASELQYGRIGMERFTAMMERHSELRAALAGVLGCDPQEVALTHNTTEGMNIALFGLDWRPGDEVITSVTEHPGGLYPVYVLRGRHGVRIRMTEIGLPQVDPLAALRRALSPRTRAVVLSHVSWSTGMVLPLRELADEAHRAGALLICDAAQAGGMVPARVADLGVDAYACSGQKWLCGPDGTGALFVRRDRLGEIAQTYIGYHGVRHGMSSYEGYYVPPEGAERYEAATLHPGTVVGLLASVRWIADELGLDWVYARIARLGRACHAALLDVPGVRVLTPADRMAGLVHFQVEGMAPEAVVERLKQQGILIRNTPNPAACRVSTGFYNTEDEIERLAEALRGLRAEAPAGAV